MLEHCLSFMVLLPNIGDAMTSEMYFEYNHPCKRLRLICMDGLRLNRYSVFKGLTSDQLVSQSVICRNAQAASLFLTASMVGVLIFFSSLTIFFSSLTITTTEIMITIGHI